MILDILKFIFDKAWPALGDRRRLRVLVHRAFFPGAGQECFFVNVTNLSHNREVEITHVWFDCVPQIPALHRDRLLPRRLKPDETWETWVRVNEIPPELHDTAYTLARARLSTGKVIKSEENTDVPHAGIIPGGPIRNI
jgi:hypothetical protein